MSDQDKEVVFPEKRFPEFSALEGWQLATIGQHLKESRTKGNKGDTAKKLTVKLWGNGVYEKNESLKGSPNTQYYRRKAGQFIYSKLDFLNQAFGIIPEHLDNYESTVDLPCFDVGCELDARFLLEYVQREDFYKTFGEIADGGRKAKRIQVDTFLNFPIYLPKFEEQQKIADCLSSVDELIAAEKQKLDDIKAHKNGLMQQLFPADGEVNPTVRFSNFQDAGDWKKVELSELGELIPGLTYKPEDVREEGLLVLRSSNVQNGVISLQDNVYVRPDIAGANISKPNDILLCVRNGSKSLIGKNALISSDVPLSTHGAFMTVFRAVHSKFVYQLFQTAAFEMQVAADLGATINSINGNRFKKYEFFIPPTSQEQEQIASFLSSVDELIENQALKVNQLLLHKKGLMQQLFPSMEEVGL